MAVGVDEGTRTARVIADCAVDEAFDLESVERLVLEQRLGHCIESAAVLRHELASAVLLRAQDPLDLLVDDPRGLVRVVAGVYEVLAEEDRTL